MNLSEITVPTRPMMSIFVRHSEGCSHRGDELYKRCSCWKHVRWFVGGKLVRRKTKSRTWEGAERFKRELEDQMDPARKRDTHQPVVIFVRDAIDTFIKEKEGQNISKGVVDKYRRELDRLHEFLEIAGVYRIDDITLPHLTAFRATWTKVYPGSLTRSKAQERLKGFFRYATLAYNLARNPAAGLTSIQVHGSPTLPFTSKEYEAILAAIPTTFEEPLRARMRALVQLMRYSGLAIRDAVCLPRERVKKDSDGVTHVVTHRAKTGVHVSMPIPPDVVADLDAVVNGNPKYIFWTGASLPDTVAKNYQAAFRDLFPKAEIVDGHAHRLRDTFAVEMLAAGVSIEDVAKMLGHTSIKTTEKHYAPWVKARQERLSSVVMATWANKPKPEAARS